MALLPTQNGLLNGMSEKSPTTHITHSRHHSARNMPSARNFFLLTLLVCLSVVAGFTNAIYFKARPCDNDHTAGSEVGDMSDQDESSFARLLTSASPEALHQLLHNYLPSYRHGIYDSDHSALEAVHENDPELASSIVEMVKRQSGNDTTSEAPISTDSSNPTTTSASDLSTTTSEQTSATTPTSDPTSDPTTAPTTDPTTDPTTTLITSPTTVPTTAQESTTMVETSTAATTPVTTTATTTATDLTTDSTTSQPTSATSSSGSTLVTTTSSSSITHKTSTFTSTLPGGAVTTVTSVEVITPGTPEEATASSSASGSLQTGLAVPVARGSLVDVLAGLVIGGVILV
ncbi:hypothetical protein F5X99DRAFT_321818 [Biscogniauxia marginata]|nr:hypothetical protein F5X99DRAFT_321818 [Biscogniauxia marginata]